MMKYYRQITQYLAGFQSDKYLHLLTSLIIAFFVVIVTTPMCNDNLLPSCIALFFTMIVGVCKEVYDSHQPDNEFSYQDLLFDIVGTLLGIVLAIL